MKSAANGKLLDGGGDPRVVERNVRRDFDEGKHRCKLALCRAVLAGLVIRDGEVVAIRFLAAHERAGASERGDDPTKITRAIKPFGETQRVGVCQGCCAERDAVCGARGDEVAADDCGVARAELRGDVDGGRREKRFGGYDGVGW